jgi:hypothetical protein
VREAVESGVTDIDTTDFYPPVVTNRLIKEALHPYERITIATNVGAHRGDGGAWIPSLNPKDLQAQVHDNLEHLASTPSASSTCASAPQRAGNAVSRALPEPPLPANSATLALRRRSAMADSMSAADRSDPAVAPAASGAAEPQSFAVTLIARTSTADHRGEARTCGHSTGSRRPNQARQCLVRNGCRRNRGGLIC